MNFLRSKFGMSSVVSIRVYRGDLYNAFSCQTSSFFSRKREWEKWEKRNKCDRRRRNMDDGLGIRKERRELASERVSEVRRMRFQFKSLLEKSDPSTKFFILSPPPIPFIIKFIFPRRKTFANFSPLAFG